MIQANNRLKAAISLVAFVAIVTMMLLSSSNASAKAVPTPIPLNSITVYTNYPAGTTACAIPESSGNSIFGLPTRCITLTGSGWDNEYITGLSFQTTYKVRINGCTFGTNVDIGTTVTAGNDWC